MSDQRVDKPAEGGVSDLAYARLDTDRAARTGDPEVVYGAGKTPAQVVGILRTLHEAHPDRAILATRLGDAVLDAVTAQLPDVVVDEVAHAVTLGPLPEGRGTVGCRDSAQRLLGEGPLGAEEGIACGRYPGRWWRHPSTLGEIHSGP